jgi:putative transposase
MLDHINEFRLIAMFRVLRVHRSGYAAWRRAPQGPPLREDGRLVGPTKHHWIGSGGVYGHRKLTVDLRETGEVCSRHRVLRLMKAEGLRRADWLRIEAAAPRRPHRADR